MPSYDLNKYTPILERNQTVVDYFKNQSYAAPKASDSKTYDKNIAFVSKKIYGLAGAIKPDWMIINDNLLDRFYINGESFVERFRRDEKNRDFPYESDAMMGMLYAEIMNPENTIEFMGGAEDEEKTAADIIIISPKVKDIRGGGFLGAIIDKLLKAVGLREKEEQFFSKHEELINNDPKIEERHQKIAADINKKELQQASLQIRDYLEEKEYPAKNRDEALETYFGDKRLPDFGPKSGSALNLESPDVRRNFVRIFLLAKGVSIRDIDRFEAGDLPYLKSSDKFMDIHENLNELTLALHKNNPDKLANICADMHRVFTDKSAIPKDIDFANDTGIIDAHVYLDDMTNCYDSFMTALKGSGENADLLRKGLNEKIDQFDQNQAKQMIYSYRAIKELAVDERINYLRRMDHEDMNAADLDKRVIANEVASGNMAAIIKAKLSEGELLCDLVQSEDDLESYREVKKNISTEISRALQSPGMKEELYNSGMHTTLEKRTQAMAKAVAKKAVPLDISELGALANGLDKGQKSAMKPPKSSLKQKGEPSVSKSVKWR